METIESGAGRLIASSSPVHVPLTRFFWLCEDFIVEQRHEDIWAECISEKSLKLGGRRGGSDRLNSVSLFLVESLTEKACSNFWGHFSVSL
jgi:hypothetical protein